MPWNSTESTESTLDLQDTFCKSKGDHIQSVLIVVPIINTLYVHKL